MPYPSRRFGDLVVIGDPGLGVGVSARCVFDIDDVREAGVVGEYSRCWTAGPEGVSGQYHRGSGVGRAFVTWEGH